ncbi:MAG: CpsD/CapB family tyrosine-protein kinase [Ruminococcus sp.]
MPVRNNEKQKLCKDLPFSATESYRSIQSNISFLIPDKKTGIVIGITSPSPQDGKTFTSVNVSYFLAESGKKVLLIDGDMRRSSVARYLEIESVNGLSEYLSSQTDEFNIRESKIHDNMDIITSGKVPPNPFVLLCSDRMKEMFEKLRESYDYILVDLPPMNVVAESSGVSRMSDGVILVVRESKTKIAALNDALRQLQISDSKIIGVIYNGRKTPKAGYYHKTYYYGKGDGKNDKKSEQRSSAVSDAESEVKSDTE